MIYIQFLALPMIHLTSFKMNVNLLQNLLKTQLLNLYRICKVGLNIQSSQVNLDVTCIINFDLNLFASKDQTESQFPIINVWTGAEPIEVYSYMRQQVGWMCF